MLFRWQPLAIRRFETRGLRLVDKIEETAAELMSKRSLACLA